MKIFKTFETSDKETAVALGFFDGVHLAHQQVINAIVDLEKRGLVPTVLTFSIDAPLPNKNGIKVILTDENKMDVLELNGVKQVYVPTFSSMANLSADEFFEDILVKKLKAKAIVCGYDYTFGKGAKGNTDKLKELCKKHDIEFTMVEQYKKDNLLVSSTLIRECIENGDIPIANKLLGYKYFIKGDVLYGNQIGNKIGFPTINQSLYDTQVIPKYGVYKTETLVGTAIHKSITNVGVKPTISGERKPLAETHILDVDQNFYGECMQVSFLKIIRVEQKFNSIDELKKAISQDINSI